MEISAKQFSFSRSGVEHSFLLLSVFQLQPNSVVRKIEIKVKFSVFQVLGREGQGLWIHRWRLEDFFEIFALMRVGRGKEDKEK